MDPSPPTGPAPGRPPDEGFSALLAACDEALAGGTPATGEPPAGSLGLRLARGAACLQLLHETLGPPGPNPQGRRLGDFELLREIGRGGMGVVYEARQVSLNRPVALKVLGPALGLSPTAIERFRREAEAAARLHHTNIVPVYTTGEQHGVHFYAMELIDGPSLDRVLAQLRQGSASDSLTLPTSAGPAAVAPTAPYQPAPAGAGPAAAGTSSSLGSDSQYFDTVARLTAEVADALEYAHRAGVIHRDVKPANLLLDPAGRLSVNDFGLARVLERPGMTMTGEFVGTPAYMSPEQITAGRVPIDSRTDIYSLGATLYELLTLRPPFAGDRRDQILAQVLQKDPTPPRRLNPKVPRDLDTICLKALDKDPARRYQTAAAMADDLRAFVNRFAIKARRAGSVARLRKWVRRNPALSAALAGAVALALLAGFFAFEARRGEQARQVERRQQAIDKALVAAMGGEFESAEAAAREAELLGAHPGWVRMMHGQIKLHRGEPREAMVDLRQAVELMPDSVAARAMFVWAFFFSGGGEGVMHEEVEALQRLQPVTPEDFLFKGQVESIGGDPARALRTLDEAVARRRSGVALLTRAWVRSRYAQDAGDLAAAEGAVEDATSARALLGDNPYAFAMSVVAHDAAAVACRQKGRTAESEGHSIRAGQFAEALAPFKNRDFALLARAFHYTLNGDDSAALAEWRRGSERGNTLAAKWYVWGLYRRGEFQEALAVCDAALGRGLKGGIELARVYVLAELDPQRARQAYEDLARGTPKGKPSFYPTALYPTAARLLGDNAEADRLGRDLGASLRRHREEGWGRALLDYNCGGLTDDQLLLAAGPSRKFQCEGHYHIALRRLAEGDRASARKHFQASAATDIGYFFEIAWSRAFLDRLEGDPNWPPRVRP
jgi:serine/threonine protein kinase